MAFDDQKLIGICGLYCGDCPYYLAPRLGDEEQLAELSRKSGLPADEIRCDGCLSDRVSPGCRECRHGFRTCAAAQGVTWCFECPDFPCQRLEDFSHQHVVNGICHHQRVNEDLAFIRDHGHQAWLDGQKRRSHCPACGRPGYWFSTLCPACGARIR